MTKLEEIARAIFCSGRNIPDEAWLLIKNSVGVELWMRQARAAVEAMRQPTEKSLDAAIELGSCRGYDCLPIWQVMIDAILNEEKPSRQAEDNLVVAQDGEIYAVD